MRITYLSQSYPPMVSGASLSVQMLAEGMAELGHQVLVLTSSDLAEPYTQRSGSLEIYHNRSHPNPFRVGQRYTRYAHRMNTKLLRKFEPDIVHVHEPFQFAYTGLKYSRKRSIPITITTHQLPWFLKAYLPEGLKVGSLLENGLWRYSNWLLRKFSFVISPTQTIANVIRERTGIRSNVINYGIELEFFQPKPDNEGKDKFLREKFGIPDGVPIIFHVGRLDVDKKVDIVVRAVARSMAEHDGHLLIVGDGTEKTRLMRMCKEYGMGERCHFPGYITSRHDLSDVYRMASVFVTASEIETQGIVLIEAAACGLPIVAANATCIPEIVKDGVTGYLIPPRDVDRMASALNKLLSNREQAKTMGKASSLLSKNFNRQRTIDGHENLYIKAILNLKRYPVSSQKIWQRLRDPFS